MVNIIFGTIRKSLRKTLKNDVNKPIKVEFLEDSILNKDDSYEIKLSLTQLEKITELSMIIFLQLRGDGFILLPKRTIDDLGQFRDFLEQLANTLNIEYVHSEAWEWK